jgi:hypothetical protein
MEGTTLADASIRPQLFFQLAVSFHAQAAKPVIVLWPFAQGIDPTEGDFGSASAWSASFDQSDLRAPFGQIERDGRTHHPGAHDYDVITWIQSEFLPVG